MFYDLIDDSGYECATLEHMIDVCQDIVNVQFVDRDIDLYDEVDFTIGQYDDDQNLVNTVVITLSPDSDIEYSDYEQHSVWHTGAGGVL